MTLRRSLQFCVAAAILSAMIVSCGKEDPEPVKEPEIPAPPPADTTVYSLKGRTWNLYQYKKIEGQKTTLLTKDVEMRFSDSQVSINNSHFPASYSADTVYITFHTKPTKYLAIR